MTPTGKLADRRWREERARKAARARTTPDHHIAALESCALTPAQLQRLDRIAAGMPPLGEDDVSQLAILLHPAE